MLKKTVPFAVLAGVLGFTAVQASQDTGVRAYFGFPSHVLVWSSQDHSLDEVIVDHLRRAVPGSTVRASLYQAQDVKLANEFIAASKRGVDVSLILDDSIAKDKDYKDFYAAINQGMPADKVHVCMSGSCIGTSNNHNKFYIFSEVLAKDGASANVLNTVLQSSENLNSSQRKKHNNLVVVPEDAALFAAYNSHWEDMRAERKDPDYLTHFGIRSGAHSNVSVYFYPTTRGNEPVLETLRHTTCPVGGGEIYLVHSLVSGDYAEDNLTELKRLHAAGCTVRLIVRGTAGDNALLPEMKNSDLDVTYMGIGDPGIHSKYLAIDANIEENGKVSRKKVVFMGSMNMKSGSVYENDETVLRIEDASIYEAYKDNWLAIKKQVGVQAPKERNK